MKQNKDNKSSNAPWEEPGEEPQQISGAEASAAAAVTAGKTDRGGNRRDGGKPDRDRRDGEKPDRDRRDDEKADRDRSDTARTGRNRWQPSQLGYRWVVRNIGFLVFLAALAVLYIYNGHYADNISRDLNRTNKEVKELQYEYKTLKSEVMFRSKESELSKAVAPFGLEELTLPPFVLIDSTAR
ncbi:MAG TPA: FtsL-like putative cell division protein [Puia sp.]|nr:FtsL-like putative cell division protein [Puia sp.]